MHIGRQFSFLAYIQWTKNEIVILALLAFIPTCLVSVLHWTVIEVPLFVATILGTSVAFLIGFKNNAAYARMMDAQKIYSEIQSTSVSFGVQLKYLPSPACSSKIKKYWPQFINQHAAWLTTLRYQLRQEQPWENLSDLGNRAFKHIYRVYEHEMTLEVALQPYLSLDTIRILLSKKNPVLYCLQLQIELFKVLLADELISDRDYTSYLKTIDSFIFYQTQCLRIKNYPYPRNFYSVTKYITNAFLIILPFALLREMDNIHLIWLTIPVSMIVSWVFICLAKVGQNTTNPFEGGINDVPISSISRDIEIELKQLLDQDSIPEEIKPMNDILT